MAFSKSVQFRGIPRVLQAYQNKQVPTWGLFQGNQFLDKYEGDDLDEGAEKLKTFLNALDQRSSDTNTYTLCVYETPGKINSATKFDASFNFRLADTIEDHYQNRIAGSMESRIAGMEEKLNQLLTDPEPDELSTKDQLLGALSKILEVPQVQHALATKLMGLIDGVGNVVNGIFTPGRPAAQIGATRAAAEPVAQPVADPAQSENEKLQQAVNILVTVDPQLGTNLLKLAGIAERDPDKYRLMITMLNSM